MSETKIQVPVGMSEAFHKAENHEGFKWDDAVLDAMLSAALRWLSENPIVPNEADVMEILQERVRSHHISGEEYCAIPPATVRFVIREWQRRMFLAPEPETSLPEEWIRACARNVPKGAVTMKIYSAQGILLETVDLEAYRRGQQSK